jgi:hypothetical protein
VLIAFSMRTLQLIGFVPTVDRLIAIARIACNSDPFRLGVYLAPVLDGSTSDLTAGGFHTPVSASDFGA